MLVEARRFRIALAAHLRNGGSIAQVRAATACSREDIDKLMSGTFGLLTGGQANRIAKLLPERERAWVAESPSWPISVGQVPCSLIAPVIEEGFSRHGRVGTANMVGLMERQLFGVMEERRGVSFRIADAIVTSLSGPDFWLSGDARRWYWSHDQVFGKATRWKREYDLKRDRRRVKIAA